MSQQTITVLSFNLWCNRDSMPQRANGVERTIRGVMPDSFGVQEATAEWRALLRERLGDAYGVACDVPRTSGRDSEGTPVFYLKDKYELVDEDVFWLSETPEVSSLGWDAVCYRIAARAVLRDKASGFTYVHFNTHFDHKGYTAMSESALLMVERMKETELPAVLTGDLNDIPGSPQWNNLAAGGLIDLRTAAAVTDEGVTFHDYKEDGKLIDYVFANGFLRDAARYWVVRDKYDGDYPSDHFAVCAAVTLGG